EEGFGRWSTVEVCIGPAFCCTPGDDFVVRICCSCRAESGRSVDTRATSVAISSIFDRPTVTCPPTSALTMGTRVFGSIGSAEDSTLIATGVETDRPKKYSTDARRTHPIPKIPNMTLVRKALLLAFASGRENLSASLILM